MSFFALITDLKIQYDSYKRGSRSDYKRFKEVVKISFNSVKIENDKEKGLKNIIKALLNKVLRYKPKKRPNFEKLISMMKKFEEENMHKIQYSEKEREHDEELLRLYMLSGKVNNLNNKIEYNQEQDKIGEQIKNKEEHKMKENESIKKV